MRLASLAYDSVGWIAKEAKKAPVSLKTLRESDAYFGVDGLVRLNADGTNKRALRIVRKTGRGVAEVSPVPDDLDKIYVFPEFTPVIESADLTSMFQPMSAESRNDFVQSSPATLPL